MIKIVTFWGTLIERARELAAAERSGDAERIAEAKARHDEYVELCLIADEMIIPSPQTRRSAP